MIQDIRQHLHQSSAILKADVLLCLDPPETQILPERAFDGFLAPLNTE